METDRLTEGKSPLVSLRFFRPLMDAAIDAHPVTLRRALSTRSEGMMSITKRPAKEPV